MTGHSPVELLQHFDEVADTLEVGLFVVKVSQDDFTDLVNVGVG